MKPPLAFVQQQDTGRPFVGVVAAGLEGVVLEDSQVGEAAVAVHLGAA